MGPQLIESIMHMLGQQSTGGVGTSGNFSTDPNADLSQQLQVGQPLDMNQQQQQMQMSGFGGQPQQQMGGMGGIGNLMGFRNNLGQNARSGMNANRSGQSQSSFLPDSFSTFQNSMMGQ